MKKQIVFWAALTGMLFLPSSRAEAQSALQIVRQIEALEARLSEVEQAAQTTPFEGEAPSAGTASPEIEALRADIARLSGDVTATRAEMASAAAVREQLDALAAELAALKAHVAVAEQPSDSAEAAMEPEVQADLAVVLADLRTYMEAAAQRDALPTAGPVTFGGRLHSQLSSSSAPDATRTDFFVRRARLTVDLRVNQLVSGRIEPDFGEGKLSVKDANFSLAFSPAFTVMLGQFKRPFDLFEITSSTRILTVERTGVVRGAGSCAGTGGICSLSRFTEKLGLSDRDIGARVFGRAGDWSWDAAVTNGTGANLVDENGTKSYTARLVYAGVSNLAIGANVAAHDYVNEVDPSREYAPGYGVDVELGNYNAGWHAQVGAVAGGNWLNLDAGGVPSDFRTAQAILAYKAPVGFPGVSAIEPVTRLSWGDPDTDVGDDHDYFATAGVSAYFTGRNKLAFNVERWIPATGSGAWSIKLQSFLHF